MVHRPGQRQRRHPGLPASEPRGHGHLQPVRHQRDQYALTLEHRGPDDGRRPGPGYIDTTVGKIGSTYHALLKSTFTKSIDFATSSSLTGPRTITKTGNRVDLDAEGPVLVELGNGGRRIFFEDCGRRRFSYADS